MFQTLISKNIKTGKVLEISKGLSNENMGTNTWVNLLNISHQTELVLLILRFVFYFSKYWSGTSYLNHSHLTRYANDNLDK